MDADGQRVQSQGHLLLLHMACLVACALAPLLLFLRVAWISATTRQAVTHFESIVGFLILAVGVALVFRRTRGSAAGEHETDLPAGSLLRRTAGAWLLLGLCTLLFTLPLISQWTSVPPDQRMIGGIVPFSDAHAYYEGATEYLNLGELNAWNQRRPLNALLLAVRLAVSGNDLRIALLWQAGMLGIAVFVLARVVSRDFGIGAGLLTVALLYAAGREHVGSTLSEALGLTLGIVATALLLVGQRDRRLFVAAIGLTILTLALNSRAGAFFMLPTLAIWAGFEYRNPDRRFGFPQFSVAVAAIAGGFLLNSCLLFVHGSEFGVGHGNFAHTLYGMAAGGTGWTTIYEDFPECKTLPESAQNGFIYEKAFERIREQPWLLVKGYFVGFGEFCEGLWSYSKNLVFTPLKFVNRVLAIVLVVVGLLFAWTQRNNATARLLLAANAGLFLSGPIIWPDGGARVVVVSLPTYLLLMALGVQALARWMQKPVSSGAEGLRLNLGHSVTDAFPAIVYSLTLIAVAFMGPGMAHRRHDSRLVAAPEGLSDDTLLVRVGATTPHIEILDEESTEPAFTPRIKREQLARYVREHHHYFDETLTDQVCLGKMMMVAYNLRDDQPGMWYVVGPPSILQTNGRLLKLRGEERQFKSMRCLVVQSVDELSEDTVVAGRTNLRR